MNNEQLFTTESNNCSDLIEAAIERDNAKLAENAKNAENMVILDLVEQIVKLAEDSRLSKEFFNTAKPFADALAKKLDITPTQAVIYSLFVENYNSRCISIQDLAETTNARNATIAKFQPEIDALERAHFIFRTENYNKDICYVLPVETIDYLSKDTKYVQPVFANLNIQSFIRKLNEYVGLRVNQGANYEAFCDNVHSLLVNNQHLAMAKHLLEYTEKYYRPEALLLVTLCCAELFHKKTFSFSNFSKLLESEGSANILADTINEGFGNLIKDDMVQYNFADGMVDTTAVTLTAKAKKLLLRECRRKNEDERNLLKPSAITKKQLFYDCEVKEQVERLTSLLAPKSFKQICRRLKANGMRQGFACLFYGAPGTGKTESVLQLAKATGRSVMTVNMSEIKDKYVGESEKRVKEIFTRYAELVKECRLCPILLFNEADAIIGKRIENVEHSVDNMYNTMQNIILQEMENFRGILIATTNLENNMDKAFERRFLYKVRFEKPSAEVRKQIWQNIMPKLSELGAQTLASKHDFSGGQIENIARKQIVDSILYGDSDNLLEDLDGYCKTEMIQDRNARKQVGFGS